MWFLGIGLVLLVLKMADLGPVAGLGWGWILAPFVLAAFWWALADSIGITQRRAMRKMEERKVARRERDMKALGLDIRRETRVRVLRESGTRPEKPAAEAPPREAPRRDPRP